MRSAAAAHGGRGRVGRMSGLKEVPFSKACPSCFLLMPIDGLQSNILSGHYRFGRLHAEGL
jgi:hypothetical protein